MWQDIIVGACVLAAVVFLVRQWLPGMSKKTSGCGGCNGCSSAGGDCGKSADKRHHQTGA
ncbi:FeoB-associated Cys-rich membrane protein [Marinobacter sp. F3R08]|uniref:FeoB-associated Cys-rich membrane protein n=1 Tax=Marinobacter sp. F3R08 TaxID=2841559 RepID=UPI001C081964|nr:FeoB-associated Cys-rich membrane protein [Marinobacter sp. F3R08]MBU2952684.1 FeoB-associated Cys-rich membrane protein [Marinobacter sp. F3R08]